MSESNKKMCPLLKKQCIEMDCVWYTSVYGTTDEGAVVEQWNCAMNWLPNLLIESSIHQRNTGASVEKFRNEMVKANEKTAEVFKLMIDVSEPHSQKTLTIK